MKSMIRIVPIMALMVATASYAGAEVVNYEVQYKWGLIDATAGRGRVCADINGQSLYATLNGQSIPWGGRIYTVSDTLQANFAVNSRGQIEQTVTYQNGWYSKPYDTETNWDIMASPANYRTILGQGTLDASPLTMEAISISTDMLNLFYLSRVMDFERWTPGDTFTIPVHKPDGSVADLVIVYSGINNDGASPAYEMVCRMAYAGNDDTFPVTVLVDTATRIPLVISADIKIGHIRLVQC